MRAAEGRLAKQALITSWMKSTKANDADFPVMVQWLTGRPFPDDCEKKLGVSGAILGDAICATYECTWNYISQMNYGHLGLTSKYLAELPGAGLNYPYKHEGDSITISLLQDNLFGIVELSHFEPKVNVIKSLLDQASPNESIYICALILGKMPPGIGIGESMILDCLSDAFGSDRTTIEEKYCLCGNLVLIAGFSRLDGLDYIQLTPFQSIMPMLAISMRESKCTSMDDTVAKQSGSVAEFKYDGLRGQVHKIGDTVKIFSRNLEDKTAQFPDVVRAAHFSFPDTDCILDGEIIVVDSQDRALKFQYVLERIQRKKDVEEYARKYPAVFKVFDLLWVDGDSCLEWEQHERREYLESIIKPSNRCHLAESFSDMDNLSDCFNSALAQGNEGLIIKDTSAKYALTLGRGLGWIKVKIRLEPLDLEVINTKPGTGRLAGMVGAIELATASGDSVGWCASGLTDATRKEIADKMMLGERTFVTVLYEEIQKSKSGYGLRFPILQSIRYDKDRADSNERVEKIYGSQ